MLQECILTPAPQNGLDTPFLCHHPRGGSSLRKRHSRTSPRAKTLIYPLHPPYHRKRHPHPLSPYHHHPVTRSRGIPLNPNLPPSSQPHLAPRSLRLKRRSCIPAPAFQLFNHQREGHSLRRRRFLSLLATRDDFPSEMLKLPHGAKR